MHCPNCGAENPDGSKFCTSCGTKLSEISEGGNADSLNTALDTSEQTSHLKHAATPEQTISQPTPEPEPQQAAEPTMYMPPVIPAPTSTVGTPIDDTAPQSRQTYADPAQFQVVSEGAASPTPHKKRSSHKAFKIVAIILLTIVLGAGIGIGAWAWNANQKNNARKDEVVKLEDSYKSQVDAIEVNPTSESDRSALLDSYKQLADIQDKIAKDQESGKFKLADGSDDSGLEAVISAISDKQKKIFDWFNNDYKTRLKANSFDESASADSIDETTLNNQLDALNKLKSDLDDEKIIWTNNPSKNSDYDSYVNKVKEQLTKGNSLKKDLKKKADKDKQDAEKEKRSSEAATQKWVGTYSGMGTDNKKLEIVLKSDGSVTYREGDTKVTEGTWSGDENTIKISFGGKISTRSEPFTITSKDGGRTIAVSSDSGTWQTDYLTKR